MTAAVQSSRFRDVDPSPWGPEITARNAIGQVGVLGNGSIGYIRDITLGISAVARTRGWLLSILGARPLPGMWEIIGQIPQHSLVLTYDSCEHVPPELIRNRVVVAADVDLTGRGIPSVIVDNHQVGAMAADHLHGTGLRSMACFAPQGSAWALARAAGFCQRLRELDPTCFVAEWLYLNDDPRLSRGEPFGPQNVVPWLQSLPKPVGIFAACDGWGAALAEFCRYGNLRVPEDVALLGVDNDEFICSLASPSLSSIELPLRSMGTELGLMIERLRLGQRLEQTKIVFSPVRVVSRRSTDTLAIDDPDVAKALSIIREHANRPLSVGQILKRVPVYQHRLERGFRKYLGRTMLQEIRRVHVQQAKALLAHTDLSIADVAVRSGFANATKLAAAFREESGITPTEYRRKTRPLA